MKIIKINDSEEVPEGYTGIVEIENQETAWIKDGFEHREDGPARIYKDGYKSWWLDGKIIWDIDNELDLTNKFILSKTQHPLYPTVQVWKILDSEGIYEFVVIPGMEEIIKD